MAQCLKYDAGTLLVCRHWTGVACTVSASRPCRRWCDVGCRRRNGNGSQRWACGGQTFLAMWETVKKSCR